MEPHKIWIEQCEAARGIEAEFGTQAGDNFPVRHAMPGRFDACGENVFVSRCGTARERFHGSLHFAAAAPSLEVDEVIHEPCDRRWRRRVRRQSR